MQLVLIILFFIAGIIHLYYYLFVFRAFAVCKEVEVISSKEPVSVIICAKNELKNLQMFLPSVIDQAYPDFEVIVVNDCSWDGTAEYLEKLKQNEVKLKIVNIHEQDKY